MLRDRRRLLAIRDAFFGPTKAGPTAVSAAMTVAQVAGASRLNDRPPTAFHFRDRPSPATESAAIPPFSLAMIACDLIYAVEAMRLSL